MEIIKTAGMLKQTVYTDATLRGDNVRLTGEVTINKSNKVVQFIGQVYNNANERIGEFRYHLPEASDMGQNGVYIRLLDSNNVQYYVEASEVLINGLRLFEA